jgi:hypothetical protein
MLRGGRVAILVVAALCACNRGSGLVQMDVDAEPGLVLDAVELSLTSQLEPGGAIHNRQVIPWPLKQSLSIGLYTPTSLSGVVWAHALGLRLGLPVAQAEPQSVSVSPGSASGPVHLRLVPVAIPGDGGVPAGDGGAPTDGGPPNDTGSPADAQLAGLGLPPRGGERGGR